MSRVCTVSAHTVQLVFTGFALLLLLVDGVTIDYFSQQGIWSLLSRHPRAIPSGRGQASNVSECDIVKAVPDEVRSTLSLDTFYQKYTHAYGIPILSSSRVQNAALHRACYVIHVMLADRNDLRNAMYDGHGRVSIVGISELTNEIPEFRFLTDEWNDRARGLGGTPHIPVTLAAEENLLCLGQRQDRWYEEDVLVHEFAHSVHLIGMNKVNDTFQTRLQEAFDRAIDEKLWSQTYAIANVKEYFAEGVQKFFNVDTHRNFIDGVHNNISTRESLRKYDKNLFTLVSEVFPCGSDIINRCQNQSLTSNHIIQMDCLAGNITTLVTSSLETLTMTVHSTVTEVYLQTSMAPSVLTMTKGIVSQPKVSIEQLFTTLAGTIGTDRVGNGVECLASITHLTIVVVVALVVSCAQMWS